MSSASRCRRGTARSSACVGHSLCRARGTARTYTRPVTLVRIAVVVVLIASGLVVFYGLILDRTGQNIAFTVAGLVVFGLTMAFIAAWFLGRALTDARWGRSGGGLPGGRGAG